MTKLIACGFDSCQELADTQQGWLVINSGEMICFCSAHADGLRSYYPERVVFKREQKQG